MMDNKLSVERKGVGNLCLATRQRAQNCMVTSEQLSTHRARLHERARR